MLISNTILVKIAKRNVGHYRQLGYKIPDNPWGQFIEVQIKDLPIHSNIKIPVQCDNCGKQLEVVYKVYYKHNHSGKYYCNNCSSKVLMSGDKHWKWNPNRTDAERADRRNGNKSLINEWRKKIYQKDNYTCQHCHKKNEHDLVAHHLNGFDKFEEQRYDVNNGITLCEQCHKNFHHIYGYGNNTKEQFLEFNKNC